MALQVKVSVIIKVEVMDVLYIQHCVHAHARLLFYRMHEQNSGDFFLFSSVLFCFFKKEKEGEKPRKHETYECCAILTGVGILASGKEGEKVRKKANYNPLSTSFVRLNSSSFRLILCRRLTTLLDGGCDLHRQRAGIDQLVCHRDGQSVGVSSVAVLALVLYRLRLQRRTTKRLD